MRTVAQMFGYLLESLTATLPIVGFLAFGLGINAAILLGAIAGLGIYLSIRIDTWLKEKPREPYGPDARRKMRRILTWFMAFAVGLFAITLFVGSPIARAFIVYAATMTLSFILVCLIDLGARRETA
ncbi:MAG: hypothetical protein JST51_00010 [Armatimonadetes bacterium]|nr:hypothetical protein [Armatimonadota bacterium]